MWFAHRRGFRRPILTVSGELGLGIATDFLSRPTNPFHRIAIPFHCGGQLAGQSAIIHRAGHNLVHVVFQVLGSATLWVELNHQYQFELHRFHALTFLKSEGFTEP